MHHRTKWRQLFNVSDFSGKISLNFLESGTMSPLLLGVRLNLLLVVVLQEKVSKDTLDLAVDHPSKTLSQGQSSQSFIIIVVVVDRLFNLCALDHSVHFLGKPVCRNEQQSTYKAFIFLHGIAIAHMYFLLRVMIHLALFIGNENPTDFIEK